MNNGRGDVLWNVLQEPSAPSYANFVNQGRTTIPESWDFAGSQNHMILLQIDEWFNAGLAGIRQAPGSTALSTASSSSRRPWARSATSPAPTSLAARHDRERVDQGRVRRHVDEGLRARGLDRDGLRPGGGVADLRRGQRRGDADRA